MANPTKKTADNYNHATIKTIAGKRTTGSVQGATIYVQGVVTHESGMPLGNSNTVYITILMTGENPTLTESSARNLTLGGIDEEDESVQTYWQYNMGLDPIASDWTLEIRGPGNNNTLTFTKAKVNDGKPPASLEE